MKLAVRLAGPMSVALALGWASPLLATKQNGFVRQEGQLDMALSLTLESYEEFWMGTTKVSDPGLGTVSTESVSLW